MRPTSLLLKMGDVTCELENESDSISIGRDASCDIVVNTALASRKHAYCELRRGKFVIVDQGTNGTYVTNAASEEVYLRREELVLLGQGSISLGKPISESEDSELIHYEC